MYDSFGYKQKMFIVRYVTTRSKIVLIFSLCVENVCSVGSTHIYGVIWWLFSILMHVFRLMCLLSYNILINIRNKYFVWPSVVFGSIRTRFPRVILLIQLYVFVNKHVPSSLPGWMPKPCAIMLLDNLIFRVCCIGKNQVLEGITVM